MNEQTVPRCSQTADALLCLPAHTPVHSGIRSSADRAMMVAAGTTDRLLDLNLSDVQNVNRSVSPNAPPGTAPEGLCVTGLWEVAVVVSVTPRSLNCHKFEPRLDIQRLDTRHFAVDVQRQFEKSSLDSRLFVLLSSL